MSRSNAWARRTRSATAIAGVRKGGAVTLVGNVSPKIELPLQSVVSRQIRLQGSCASNGEYPACIEMMSRGAIQVDTLISAVAPLAEGAVLVRPPVPARTESDEGDSAAVNIRRDTQYVYFDESHSTRRRERRGDKRGEHKELLRSVFSAFLLRVLCVSALRNSNYS